MSPFVRSRSTPRRRATRQIALAVVAAAALAACAGSAPASEPTSAGTAAPDAPTTTAYTTDAERIAASVALFSSITPDQPGCSVAVAREGVVVWSAAFGAASLDPLTPLTTDSIVDIGSTSKQFTATAIALLVQRGVLNLSDKLATWMPALPAWAQTVTIEQMVHHTSGIPDYLFLLLDEGALLTAVSTDADALRVLTAATALEFTPGDHFSYSNSNYFLLGQIVQQATGEPLQRFVQREVFDAAGMVAVMDPTAMPPTKARSYRKEGGRWKPADSPWSEVGDGGVQTTPTQLALWATQYWAPTVGGADINTQRFHDAAVDPASGGRYGFGIGELAVGDLRVLSHGGSWGGFVTTFVVAPDLHLAVAGTCTAAESAPTTPSGDPGLTVLQIWA